MGRLPRLSPTLVWSLPLVIAACTSQTVASPTPNASSAKFYLGIANLDGPAVDVSINGRVVAHVVCQLVGVGGPTFTPGPGLPLPWTVTVTTSGRAMGQWTETGAIGPRTILVRGDQAGEFSSEDASGGPVPQGTCPP